MKTMRAFMVNAMAALAFPLVTLPLDIIANQTATLSPVYPETKLPFTVEIDTAPFQLPTGLQSFETTIYKNEWIFLAGRTNGLHGFDNVGNNFPPQFQNTEVFVVDPETGDSISRDLSESGLSQSVIETLSVTNSQSIQKRGYLYMVGGYGYNSALDTMETKSTLTVIDLEKLVKWVKGKKSNLKDAIRQVSHPILQVTGGSLFQNSDHDPFLLMVGQNFVGLYRADSNGTYTKQIRSFWVIEEGDELFIYPKPLPAQQADWRRRDLNIVPVLHKNKNEYVIFSGVFTLDTGVWTVPITVYPDGTSFEPDPNDSSTFKQAMNHYDCPVFGLYSLKSQNMYVVLPGGISFGYFANGSFQTDSEIPFINQVTTIRINKDREYKQYLMNNEYPFIASTGSNPGNQLLFGAEAKFFLKEGISVFSNEVIQLDKIDEPTVVGYIAGGIMSTLPNTNVNSDSTSSPYVFTVTVVPK